MSITIQACANCGRVPGEPGVGVILDSSWCEPHPDVTEGVYRRAWLCEDCRIVHWARLEP